MSEQSWLNLSKEISDLRSEMQAGFSELQNAIKGDRYGNSGLLGQLEYERAQRLEIEKEMNQIRTEHQELKNKVAKIVGYAVGAGAGAGVASGSALKLLIGA